MMDKAYLGDSVYISRDEQTNVVKLTTENGSPKDPSNCIYMEFEVVGKFIDYIRIYYPCLLYTSDAADD